MHIYPQNICILYIYTFTYIYIYPEYISPTSTPIAFPMPFILCSDSFLFNTLTKTCDLQEILSQVT